jgi:hypothetical protein
MRVHAKTGDEGIKEMLHLLDLCIANAAKQPGDDQEAAAIGRMARDAHAQLAGSYSKRLSLVAELTSTRTRVQLDHVNAREVADRILHRLIGRHGYQQTEIGKWGFRLGVRLQRRAKKSAAVALQRENLAGSLGRRERPQQPSPKPTPKPTKK